MAGNQSRGAVQSALTRGWDSTKIPAGNGEPAFDLSKWDVDPGNAKKPGNGLGTLPGGTPDGWRDGYDVDLGALRFDADVPWTAPDYTRENKVRRTVSVNVGGVPPRGY